VRKIDTDTVLQIFCALRVCTLAGTCDDPNAFIVTHKIFVNYRKHSESAGTSAKAKLFARWRHHLRFASGSLIPPLTQW